MEMEKTSFVEIGEGLRLPIGFRFRPTDEELVVHYLKRKIHYVPLPASVIPEQQVFDRNPWDLPGDLKDRRYFFTKDKEDVKKSRGIVKAGSGYWNAIGKEKAIVVSLGHDDHHQIVGMKRSSVFCQRKKRPQRIKTWWVMHQFFLVDSLAKLPSTQNLIVQTGDWFACCIFQQKKRGARKKGVKKQESNRQGIIELNIEEDNHKNIYLGNSPTQECSSPSCSSGVTEIESSYELEIEQDQEASSCGCFATSI